MGRGRCFTEKYTVWNRIRIELSESGITCGRASSEEVHFDFAQLKKSSRTYTERQKKLITSSGRRSLKSTPSKLIIVGHKQAPIFLNKNIS